MPCSRRCSTAPPPPCCAPKPGARPRDRALRELVGELSTLSPEFRDHWTAHDVLIRHDGIKRLRHPEAGYLDLTFQSLDLPAPRPKTGSSSAPVGRPPDPGRRSPPATPRPAGPAVPAGRSPWRGAGRRPRG
ncbi:hypothetical protein ABZ215_42970 [Amycolatopsis sp. NPDC006131]|uniref:MmyB family transcriptional regulator n=1 Tax=Amycolatopsis sp. NPDC006131 TaxID=3156731 RepID=UPI0033AE721D